MSRTFYRDYGKRLFDLAVAIPMFMLFLPVIAITAVFVRIHLGSPVLFRQQRPGLRGKLFRICKFRTMTDERDVKGDLLSDDTRLKAFGKFLRASSLDELPEIWNVIVGQMSLVGPRPLRVSYLPLYTAEQARRHDVTPGITGWAQVNGRNSLEWGEKFILDVWYVDNVTFLLDLQILWMTAMVLLSRKGVTAEGCVSMHSFEGNKSDLEPITTPAARIDLQKAA